MNSILNFKKSENAALNQAIGIFSRETADEALVEFMKLVNQGCNEALSFVGNLYECGGRNVERDCSKAKFYYERAVESAGSIAAYLGLVRIYYYGLGVEKDCCRALEYCEVLIREAGHPYASFYVGKIYMEGCCVEKDLNKSKKYFKDSWRQGYVFGLTYLGLVEQESGYKIIGWLYRIKSGIMAYFIARNDINDYRIREL